ncbi:MAG: D-glycerate dehydrogenase [Ardenticatenia bacterium]|nr:D-glycerate dehydrogenase [Ardenticatenia bacterium]
MSSRPLVYLTRPLPEGAVEALAPHCEIAMYPLDEPVPPDVLRAALADSEGLYCLLTDRIDAALLEAAPRLRVISQMAVGYDNIDVAACTARGIPVGNTPGVLTETTADLTFALMLATARRVVEAAEAVHSGQWRSWRPTWLIGADVWGATLGIVGMGRIGAAVARRAAGFGMRILYHNRSQTAEAAALGAEWVPLDELLAQSDFVSLHCPLTAETTGLVDEAFLRGMKRSAIFINTARGPMVDEAALYRALSEGWIHAAGLDVTAVEPIPMDSPLLTLPNCLILPHVGSATVATRRKMALMAADNLLAGLAGKRLPNCVNPEVYG